MRRWFLICSILFLLLFTACKVDSLVSQGTIRFNPNGGSGYMTAQTVFAGQPQKLFTNAYTRDDYYFLGWNTQKDGAGTFYKENETYTYDGKESEMNLYAQWKKDEGTYSICFVDLMNGYESKTIEVGYGQEYKLPSIKTLFIHENKFIEWNTASVGSGDSYANEAVVKNLAQPGRTVYLYARWAIEISYNLSGGSMYPALDSVIVKSLDNMSLYSNEPSTMTPPSIPVNPPFDPPYTDKFYPGYVFRGWCTDPSCYDGTVYLKKGGNVEGIAPAKDTTVYAIWGYNYHTDELRKNKINVFHVNPYTAITHCEQLLGETNIQKFCDFLHFNGYFVMLASGPIYEAKLVDINVWEKGKEITRKVGNSRYGYVVWDNEKDTYALFDFYGRIDTNIFWKDDDTDVLVVFNVESVYNKEQEIVYTITVDQLPSKDYMSTWGNPTVRASGDQIDPLIFRTLFPDSSPSDPKKIFSSSRTEIASNYFYVTTYAPVGSLFWNTGIPLDNPYYMVMTARF